jgi:hypothetical protein
LYEHGSRTSARVRNEVYHHGFVPNYAGVERWGRHSHWLYTNSLGLKDGSPRAIAPVADGRRVLVIGDSFTEAIGLSFENSYVGMLHRAGQAAAPKTEFLNAGVSGYSAAVYYRKVKFLLDNGVKFDEVLVALDAGEVPREATMHFCIDRSAQYRLHCDKDYGAQQPVLVTRSDDLGARIKRSFVITDSTRLLVKNAVLDWNDARDGAPEGLLRALQGSVVTGWPTMGAKLDDMLKPLGVEGGVVRARQNMQALADLLAEHGIALSVSVHPWPAQLAQDDRHSRAVEIWRPFCARNCKAFIDLFPAFFAYKDAHPDWYSRLFIIGDVHYSTEGNQIMFRELAKHLL